MSIKTAIVSRGAHYWTSAAGERARRRAAERDRKRSGADHVVQFFHDVSDPYSWLLLQCLPAFASRYAVRISPFLVGAPDDGAAPERALLGTWSRRDAALLAARAGLDFAPATGAPDPSRIAQAERLTAGALAQPDWIAEASRISAALWSGAAMPAGPGDDAAAAKAAGDRARQTAGHYLGGVLSYGGENYWGIDRLHYLETRLTDLGLRAGSGTDARQDPPLYAPPPDIAGPVPARAAGAARPALHYYLSFRSPYTWIAAQRVKALADAHGADLHLRFVLPMVMRNLPVPPIKGRYITLDTAREARRLGIPFGRIADPVGRPVERGYALLPWARAEGRGIDFCIAFMQAVWSQGVDAGSDAGMKRIVTAAGLDWTIARTIVDNDDWREEAEANRIELLDLGLWGVPSFRVGDFAVWGQDRLWAIDAALRNGASP